MKTNVTSFGVLLTLSAAALAQTAGFPQGTLDIDSLRSQVMSRHFGPADGVDLGMDLAPSLMTEKQDLDEQIWSEWGVTVAPVPELLYMHCPTLKPDAGLLIEAIRPGSPAQRAGLVAGQVVAGVQEMWLFSAHDLPSLIAPRTLTVLVAGQLREVEIQPNRVPLSASKSNAELHPAPSRSSAVSTAADAGGSQAISLACANGIFEIEASYATAEGQQKVHLSGTRRQIDKSMADLPASLRQAIERRLQTVSPAGPIN